MGMAGLWQAVEERTRSAQASGALAPIATDREVVEHCSVRFVVHILNRLERKLDATAAQARDGANPFLPPDPALRVADVSPTHLCALNRFNVIDHHLLIVTRHFEDQEELLTLQDLEALTACMAEVDGLAFYNSGVVAGASQTHKHLQLTPAPLGPGPDRTPVDRLLAAAETSAPSRLTALPFSHAALRLTGRPIGAGDAGDLHRRYRALLEACQLDTRRRPYNLVLTRDWMLVVPRAVECFAGISVNALGFAGSLLVRDREQLTLVQSHGPMNVLREVAEGS